MGLRQVLGETLGGEFLLLAREPKKQLRAPETCAKDQAQLLRRQRKLVHGEQTAAVHVMVAKFPGWQFSRHINYKCVLWHKNKPQEAEVLALKRNFHT